MSAYFLIVVALVMLSVLWLIGHGYLMEAALVFVLTPPATVASVVVAGAVALAMSWRRTHVPQSEQR